ncbi:sigma 54-interacting transcriptional regulator [Tunicatimonas pelagia]|uniref:sigma 54-interacting transcriptional regulator n=1 Tax=Tunicatimonas pelagia TaxID=931531 RepID=UPI00266591A5|nr:sigma 54-interacting transcriptional regulator [Tunicatimonas pelagia]WKN44815.1 sigma 54-interacting transcriptional regulator [Tunicatimonas pelagia]
MNSEAYKLQLEINKAIASVRERKSLVRLIADRLQPIFSFHDIGLFVLSEDGKTFCDWAAKAPSISPSEGNTFFYQREQQDYRYEGSGFQKIASQITEKKRPIVASYRECFLKEYLVKTLGKEVHSHLLAEGYDRFLAFDLKSESGLKGLLFLNYLEDQSIPEKKLPLLEALVDQLIIAITNIQATEQLQEEKSFKETLLEISESLATVNDRKSLYPIVVDKLRKHIPFDDAVVIIYAEDYQTYHGVLTVSPPHRQNHPKYDEVVNRPNPITRQFKEILESDDVAVFHLTDWQEKYPDHPGIQIHQDEGLAHTIKVTLRDAGKVIGAMLFHFTDNQFKEPINYRLYENIAYQMSVTINNILANERLIKEKQLTEKLLGISEDIAKITDRAALFQTIFDRLKPLFHFDDAVIHLKNEDGLSFFMIHSDQTSITPENPHYQHFLQKNIPIEDSPFSEIFDYDTPRVSPLAYYEKRYPEFPGVKLMREMQYVAHLVIPLISGNQKIGVLEFHSKNADAFQNIQEELLKGIADQMSVAVSNVLANEQLLEEKQKTEDLLSITKAIANITTGPELVRAIFDKLQKVFPFHEAGLFHLDFENNKERDLIVDYSYESTIANSAIQTAGITGWLPMTELSKKVSQETLVLPINEFYEQYDHPHFEFTKRVPFTNIIVGPLKQGERVIGLLYFWSKGEGFEKKVSLFKSITDQISVALNNIIANEDLIAEKNKTEDLLSITEAIANITTGSELVRAIFDKLQKVFPFDEAGLFHLDFENERERDLTIDYNYDISGVNTAHREEGLIGWIPLNELSRQLAKKAPSIMKPEEIYNQFDHPQNVTSHQVDFQQVILGPLKQGDQTIGLLFFWSKTKNAFDDKLSLFKSICDQFSVALSNILANENIAEREQFKSLQAGILSAFETSFKPKENFAAVTRLFQETIPFDMLAFSIYDAQSKTVEGHGYRKTGKSEYQYIDEKSFLNILDLDQGTFIKSWKKLDYNKTQFFNAEAFLKSLEKDAIKKILHKKIGFQSSLISPVELNQEKTLLITFFSLKTDSYRYFHRDLVDKIAPSIRLAMDRILAFRDIQMLSERLKLEKDYLEEELKTNYNLHQIVGSSDAIRQVFAKIDIVKNTDTTVLITGETGTGKELVARALHDASNRKDKTLVKVNCATLPRELVESELFGHEKGAFTGALKQRIGKFELAHGGTIFLDEIGELPLELQAKLLRVIQEKEFERLGGNKLIKTDARIIAATNRDLEHEVAEGRFRSDLYFRLSVFPIHLPPLRNRKEDIEELAYYFLEKFCRKTDKKIKKLSASDLERMTVYEWPGNIRELEHIMERSVLMSTDLKLHLAMERPTQQRKKSEATFEFKTMQQVEADLIYETLKRTSGKVRGRNGAAEILGLPASTLQYRMKRAGITKAMVIGKNDH